MLGHAAGDQLLVAVGIRLSNVIRAVDTVGRLGGVEFVILVEGASLAPGAEAVAQRVLDVDATVRRLKALKDIGVHLAIDDFGIGTRHSPTSVNSPSTS